MNPLMRIHESDVGASTFAVFVTVLPQTGMPASSGEFIHIREQLQAHNLTRNIPSRYPINRPRIIELRLGTINQVGQETRPPPYGSG
jgi:hypothetical protein